jgi:3D (Asp-Asp-Asp) domain-containing protein
VDGKTIQANSAAKTVGEALAANGISLQNLDYSTPVEDSPLPKDGKITVVRVKLLVLDEQQVIPYTVEYNYDSSLSTATKIVTRAGKSGLSNVRVVVRYENGTEKSRETESKVVLQEAVNEQVTTGTQTANPTVPPGSIGTIDTGNGVYGYYLTMSVHATSYSPCNSGSTCMDYTASGAPVTQGVIAVTTAWYRILKGYKIYVPGYGIATVEDTGGGIPGENWIDLGYTDEEYIPWSKWVTVYFLSPTPTNFTGSLP